MSKYFKVTIQATIQKTLQIKVDDDQSESEAVALAHESFSVQNDDIPETYEEDTVSVDEVSEEDFDTDQPIY
jgi:hypothetical protein